MNRRHFRRRDHSVPELNMAALPDLIFTVLFFFMIVTHMRDVDLKVRYEVPAGTEVSKLAHKSAVVDVYIGRPADSSSEEFMIQLDNQVATVADIGPYIERERHRMSAEDQERLTVNLRADRDVPMGLINDVKQALRQSYALDVSYSATVRAGAPAGLNDK